MRKEIHNFCFPPGTAFPSTAASEEEDRDECQCSYQEDGEDHQEEHITILLLLNLEWDLLSLKRGSNMLQIREVKFPVLPK